MPAPKDPIKYNLWLERVRAARAKGHSEETRKKLGLHRIGKRHSEETINKMKLRAQKRLQDPIYRENLRNGIRRAYSENPEYRKHQRESKIGDKNPCWNGGSSFEPYCVKFNDEFKERVRAFFNHQCVECGEKQKEKKLAIHHVNFKKDSCCNKDIPQLFVPLCWSCHGKTNFNRGYWEQHFTEIINTKYGGLCFIKKGELH